LETLMMETLMHTVARTSRSGVPDKKETEKW
jgi:hypothetical protein